MKNQTTKTIVLTGGGTAGHVTPHLTLLPSIQKQFQRVEYIGSKTGIEKQLITTIPYHGITTCKLVRKKFFKNLLIPFQLAKGTHQAKKLLKQIKPNVIFSKGGYVSLPVVRAAKKLKIPVIAHESDKTPGLANKLTSKHCKIVFTSFKDTAQKIKNGVYSGPPLPPPKNLTQAQAKQILGIQTTKPVLLVTGGSLGAQALNQAVTNALYQLTQKYFVYHVTGKGNTNQIQNPSYKQVEFETQMPIVMRAASLALTRGGSNTIFELANNLVPMLIVPLPKGNSRGDQIQNAAYFASNGFSSTLLQNNLNPTSLTNALNQLSQNSAQIKSNQKQIQNNNACQTILNALVSQATSSFT